MRQWGRMDSTYSPPSDPLSILHQDHEIVVLDKPAGLLSVPGRGPDLSDCLITRLQAVFPEALLVHRLDRDTSGVIVFALTPHAQRNLSMQFEEKRTKKTYHARLNGLLEPREGTVDLPLDERQPSWPVPTTTLAGGAGQKTGMPVWRAAPLA